MSTEKSSPWASGPREILKHGLELLAKDSDTNRRLAMISIDNSVELMIKTFLGLPKRVNGLTISRAKRQEISESFPKMLDALEEYASEKLDGLDLGEIEWYHRLRNQLYHDGNGLTVERDKVEVYSELARLLFSRLFDAELELPESQNTEVLGQFIFKWSRLEKGIINYSEFITDTYGRTPNVMAAARILSEEGKMEKDIYEKFNLLRKTRNDLVHGVVDHKSVLTDESIQLLDEIDNWLCNNDKQYSK